MAFGQFECVLALECIRRVVALEQIGRIVKKHADVGTAFHINQAQGFTLFDAERPVCAAGQGVGVERVIEDSGIGHGKFSKCWGDV